MEDSFFQLFPILTIMALPVVAFDWGAFFIFASLALRRPIPQLRAFLVLEGLTSLLTVYLTFLLFASGFGPGGLIIPGSILATIIGLVAYVPLFARNRQQLNRDPQRRRIYLIGTMVIVLLTLLPAASYFPVKNGCSTLSRGGAAPLIQALADYQRNNGHYPDILAMLLPDYLPSIPRPICSFFGQWPWDYRYATVDGNYVLVVATVDLVGCDRYESREGRWFNIYSSIDGGCWPDQ